MDVRMAQTTGRPYPRQDEGGNDMDFFSKLGETITETSKDVSQKAKELTGIAKLNLDIKAKEDFVERQYMEIGKQYFELHKEDEEPFFEEISLIRETLQEISQLKSEIDDLKGKKKCPSCGASLGQEDAYCNKCGAKCESIFEEETMAKEEPDDEGQQEEPAMEETESVEFTEETKE